MIMLIVIFAYKTNFSILGIFLQQDKHKVEFKIKKKNNMGYGLYCTIVFFLSSIFF